MSQEEQNEFMHEDLFEAYCLNTLDQQQHDYLHHLLQSDETVKRSFADYILFRSAMIASQSKQSRLESQRILANNDRRALLKDEKSADASASEGRVVGKKQRRRRSGVSRNAGKHIRFPVSLRVAAALAVCAVLGFLLTEFTMNESAQFDSAFAICDSGSAQLLRGEDMIDIHGSLELQIGDQLIVDATSEVKLQYADHSYCILTGGKMQVLGIGSQKELRLQSGTLHASITRQQGEPLRIIGATTEALIIGTEFTLHEFELYSELQVNSGKVRFMRLADGESLIVASGEYARRADGVAWQVFKQKTAALIRLRASDARIDVNSGWAVVDDELLGMSVLEDQQPTNEQDFINKGIAEPPARFSVFLEANTEYTLWLKGCFVKSERQSTSTDSVFVRIPDAIWDYNYDAWRAAEGWEWLPKSPSQAMAIYNGWATYAPDGSYVWVAGPASKDDKDVPKHLHFHVLQTGVYEIAVHPITGPLRLSELCIRVGDETPE